MSLVETEVEKYINEAGQVHNEFGKRGKITKPATRYLRFNERRRRETEINRLKEMTDPRNMHVTGMGEVSRGQALKHLQSLEDDIAENSPPTDLKGETKDALLKESRRLEEKIVDGMLTQQDMRRNRPGAVDRHIKWEKKNKADILKWKNIQMLMDPQNEEMDIANIERLRPEGNSQVYDSRAQIPGPFAMTPQAKANFDQTFPESPTIDTPLKQAERRELEELRARLSVLEAQSQRPARTGRRTMTEEQRAEQSRKMKERWAEKKTQTE